jgi:hypothetical protein
VSRYVQIDGQPYKVIESLGYNPDVGARVLQVEDVAGMRHTAVGSRGAYRLWTARDRVRLGSKVRGQSDA